jgi:hypothetical protein
LSDARPIIDHQQGFDLHQAGILLLDLQRIEIHPNRSRA